MTKLISIIIPYYKNATSIFRALNSISLQVYKNYEVIIVNDASPDWDEGLLIINSFRDDRFIIISHSYNENGAVARNTGINQAKGEYIAFLDADDEWKSSHLSNLLNLMKKENTDVVYSSCTVLSQNNFQYTVPKKSIELSNNLAEYLFSDGGFIQTSCLLLKSSLAKKVLFNHLLIRHQDYDFLLRVEKIGARFSWSIASTVLVHWENNDINKKGGTWEFSLLWFDQYKRYMTSKAQTFFILKFVIYRVLKERKIIKGMKYFFVYCKPRYLTLKDFYFLFSHIVFGKIKLPKSKIN